MVNTEPTPPKASVMAGRGYYSRHSEPQGAAAAPGFGYLAAAAAAVPLPAERFAPITIADYGCAGGTNEVRPMEILLEGLRTRRPSTPINVLHTDLPENDFGSLFALLADPARSYPTGREPVYPTWNRTLAEFLAPFEPGGALSGALEVVEHRFDITDDARAYPQFASDGDAETFAAAYTAFARAITEPSFFRWLRTDRPSGERDRIIADFYRDLQARIAADPVTATCHWRVATLRIRRPA